MGDDVMNWERKIIYKQYNSGLYGNKDLDFRDETPIKENDMKVRYYALCINTAKAMLTNPVTYSVTTSQFVRSYFHTIPCLLSEKDRYLAIDHTNKDILRDFSKSTRLGELAQGLSYQLCKEKLGAVTIFDFKQYLKKITSNKGKTTGRTPDYVLCDGTKKVKVLESKGTMAADPTPRLISAKEQFENGRDILINAGAIVTNAYASTVSFATSSPDKRNKRKTTAYVVDPEEKTNEETNSTIWVDRREALSAELAKFFCIAGNLQFAEAFREGMTHGLEELELPLTAGEAYTLSTMRIMTDNGEVQIEFGLTKQLTAYLIEEKKSIKKKKKAPPKFETKADETYQCFDDGTYIKET